MRKKWEKTRAESGALSTKSTCTVVDTFKGKINEPFRFKNALNSSRDLLNFMTKSVNLKKIIIYIVETLGPPNATYVMYKIQ